MKQNSQLFTSYVLIFFQVSATYLAWTREQTFDNKLSRHGYNVISRSRLHCSRACSKNSSCISFFFAPDQVLNCQLHENIISSAAGLPSVPGSKYYILDQGKPVKTDKCIGTMYIYLIDVQQNFHYNIC